MQYLSANKTAYNAYFKWKKHVSFNALNLGCNAFCDMCFRLQYEAKLGQMKRKIMRNLGEHWSKEKNCKTVALKSDGGFSFISQKKINK